MSWTRLLVMQIRHGPPETPPNMHLRQSEGSTQIDDAPANMHPVRSLSRIRSLSLLEPPVAVPDWANATVRKTVGLSTIRRFRMVGLEGFEPPTHGLGNPYPTVHP